jgi:MFS family permease
MQDKARKMTWLASLGAGLEYYDFIIYGMMASYLSPLFFPSDESWMGLLKVFGVFAIGYGVRPLGGMFFGMLGDIYVRKHTFLAVMALMAFSTLAIGLLPTYAVAGSVSPLLLIFFRILQGLSFGAELPGAITVVCEYTSQKKQGMHTGYVISSVSIGAMLASFVLYLLSHHFSVSQIKEGIWRLPFLLGGSLAFANFFIRKHLGETPAFTRLQESERHTKKSLLQPVSLLIKGHWKEVLIGIGMTWWLSSMVMFSLYFPTYLSQHFEFNPEEVYYAITWGMIGSAISLPFIGFISDKVGKREFLLVTCLGFMVLSYFFFKMIQVPSQGVLILFMMIYQTIISCLTVCFWPLLAGLFPTNVRYTGLAVCYNITYSIMGCLPMIMTLLIQTFQTAQMGVIFLMGSALVTAISCVCLRWRLNPSSLTLTE